MAVDHGSIRPRLERTRLAQFQRGDKLLCGQLAVLIQLRPAQRTFGVKRSERGLAHSVGNSAIEPKLPRLPMPDVALAVAEPAARRHLLLREKLYAFPALHV